jgi:AraC-like DNA-binding protein
MTEDPGIVASGNLATRRRTITGLLGQLALLQINDDAALKILTDAGLPGHALVEPDFPISLDQELGICLTLALGIRENRSPTATLFNALSTMGIENLGVLGMAMRHAPTALEALKICMAYPQLTWGHSRLVVRRQDNISLFSFSMERPALRDVAEQAIDTLMEYCLVLDLLNSLRNVQELLESRAPPLYISFSFPQPDDWGLVVGDVPSPVQFSEPETCFALPAALDNQPLPRANPVLHRSYMSIAEKLSQMLAEDFSFSERVSRWLWAYTPPPKRAEVAKLLAMSERNLTRQLGREGTSFTRLVAQVQAERAKNFLRNPLLRISAISERLGYAEPAAFTRAFTSWTGTSPLKWRQGADLHK